MKAGSHFLPEFCSKLALRQVFFAAAIFYLCFHALSGERGLYALFRESHELEIAKAALADAAAERADIEHHVRMLSSASLDLDLLDEQARRMSGLANEDEIVYFPSR